MLKFSGNEPRILLWVEALESGNYRQANGKLRVEEPALGVPDDEGYSYCCLGVAIEVALANGYKSPETESYEIENDTLWEGVVTWYGLSSCDPVVVVEENATYDDEDEDEGREVLICATEANDENELSFPQIAAGIRTLYLGEAADA